ncbi:MAG: zinc ABC transporter substrate-binding protein [Thiohalocapsa sp.]|nr:zinc ABC transporter substrate-binding protein [Thiohalocapsa sp.]
MRQVLLLVAGLLAATQAAALDVVATSPSMGALVRAVAGDRADVTVLAGPERDLHAMQVKPSMIRAMRGADLVVAIGAELEIGWLPAVSASAANPRILPGQPGYFEAAAQVPLLEAGGAADRGRGDVHPVGNPHVDMDPVRMATVAGALADRLALLDAGGASAYRANAAAFRDAVEAKLEGWQSRVASAAGVVLYHRDAIYLLERLGVPLLGTIEPIPGVPPTGSQLKTLAGKLAGKRGVIIYAPYQSPKGPKKLADDLGWPVEQLPLSPPSGADGNGYLSHIDRWVAAVATGS